MKSKYLLALTVICLILALVFVACGTQPPAQEEAQPEVQEEAQPEAQEETQPEAQEEAKVLRLAAVLPGSIKDEGYNQDFYEGLLMVQ
ncbi:MAG: hypothetical protein JXA42_09630, partial [Anaerolineales bacterium]|nr:hypothetical protein [Anaerolineales bacterium]